MVLQGSGERELHHGMYILIEVLLNVCQLMRYFRARSINRSEWWRMSAPRMGLETSATMKVLLNLWTLPKSRESVLIL